MFNKFKLFMITMVVLLALPVMASAYTISPHLLPAEGGSISPGQVTGLADTDTQDFVITPNAGYEIKFIKLGSVETIYSGATNTGGFTDLGNGSYQITAHKVTSNTTLNVTFGVPAAEIFGISRTAGAGGAITTAEHLTETQLQTLALGSNVTLVVAPNVGYELATFTVDGVNAIGDLVNSTYTFTNITADHTVAATFNKLPATVAVNAGADIILPAVGELGALKASVNLNQGEYTCQWSTLATDLTIADLTDSEAACSTTVTTDTAGQSSVVTLTVTDLISGLTYPDTLTVTAKGVAQAEAELCASCHTIRNGVDNVGNYKEVYNANGELIAPHTGGFAAVPNASNGQGMYTAGASCSDCHTADHSAGDFEIYTGYAESGHGDTMGEAWTHYPWPGFYGGSCEACHTTTGFVNALTGSSDIAQVGEVLTCVGCHSDAGTGELRATDGQQTITYGASSYTYPELGASDLCVRCHSGRASGDDIKAATDFDNLGFINSHYLAAGSDVFGATGYTYGATPTGGYHQNIGVDNTQNTGTNGPCVTCHMGIDSADHTWDVANSNACINCHSGLTAAVLEEAKTSFAAALQDLKTALDAKGIYFQASHPYFFDAAVDGTAITDWTIGGTMDGEGVMGAAFNYNLFEHDPGAYAHNRGYALQLIADSIDFLADGVVNGAGTVETSPGVFEDLLGEVEAALVEMNLNGHGTEIVSAADTNTCAVCHDDIQAEWATSPKAETRTCTPCHSPNGETTNAGANGQVGCAGCHVDAQPVVDAFATCGTCHDQTVQHSSHGGDELALVQASKHAELPDHAAHDAVCQRCHTSEGSIAFATFTGDSDVMAGLAGEAGLENPQAPTCASCHDPHTGGLRVVEGWDPNQNGEGDQFDLCTSCHTYYDGNGELIGSTSTTRPNHYHEQIWWTQIPATHYDDPATAESIEGYVIREDSENPCFDCHGHELRADTHVVHGDPTQNTIFTEWAESGHAGNLLANVYSALDPIECTDADYDGLVDAGLPNAGEPSYYGIYCQSEVDATYAAGTGKNAWNDYNFTATGSTLYGIYPYGECQQCHTATGYANKMDDPENYDPANNDFSHLAGWNATDGSTQAEMLYCWACHTDTETGAIRASGASTLDYTHNGQPVVIPDVGASNACINCHVGWGSEGPNVVNTDSRGPFHHVAGAAVLYAAETHIAAEFPGQDYTIGYFKHDDIGTFTMVDSGESNWQGPIMVPEEVVPGTGTSGPCAGCHMGDSADHTFEIVQHNELGEPFVPQATQDYCATCHAGHGDVTAEFLEEESAHYQDTGKLLSDLLANTVTNYTNADITGSVVANDVLANKNAKLVDGDPGGYAHNRQYSKKILFDSIDWVDNGALDGSITIDAVAYPGAAAWLNADAVSGIASRP